MCPMHASGVQQTFWDRIPNATSKVALLSKKQHSVGAGLQGITESMGMPDLPPPRISKRKQRRPMRSPQPLVSHQSASDATPAAHSSSDECIGYTLGHKTTKSRKLSLDHTAADAAAPIHGDCCTELPGRMGLGYCASGTAGRIRKNTASLPCMSRAFRFSFSDDYSRNPHKYVQALLDSENVLESPQHKPISVSRPRRSHHGHSTRSSSTRDHSRSKPLSVPGTSTSARRSRSARFHNLQLEQALSATQSENDDTNSITTAASDLHDLADIDSHVPGTPSPAVHDSCGMNSPRSKTPFTERSSTPRPSVVAHQKSHSSLGLVPTSSSETKSPHLASQALGDELDEAAIDPPSVATFNSALNHPDSPASTYSSAADSPMSLSTAAVTPANVDSLDNIPSYLRLGQDFSNDVWQITPPCKKSTVKWTKADPIEVSDKPMADKLASAERHCCSILRILPEQYITIKHTLLKEGRNRAPGTFKKRDAQRLCRIDVNKTSKIYEWYVSMGWLPASNGIYAIPPAAATASDTHQYQ